MIFISVTYLLSGLLLFLVLKRFVGIPAEDSPRLLMATLAAGPAMLSWFSIHAIKILPGHDPIQYFGISISPLVILAVLAWPARFDAVILLKALAKRLAAIKNLRVVELLLLLVVITSVSILLAFSLLLPLHENDALQYVFVASKIVERSSISFYPVVPADPETGFYAVSSHPPGFMGIYVWTYLANSITGPDSLVKIVAPIFALFTIAALASALWAKRPMYWMLAALMLLAAPVYFSGSAMASIDSYRICLFYCAALWMMEAALADGTRQFKLACVAGVFCGLSMYAHSISLVITLPLLGLPFLAFARSPFASRVKSILTASLIAMGIGAEQLLVNYVKFGMPIYDSLPVLKLSSMQHTDYVMYSLGIFSKSDLIFEGFLSIFTHPSLFGFTYWVLGGWLLLRKLDGGPSDIKAAYIHWGILAGFFGIAALTVAAGTHSLVSNARYLISVQPIAAYLGAIIVGSFHEIATRGR